MSTNSPVIEVPQPETFTWRPVTREDAPSIASLYQEVARADKAFWGGSIEGVLEDFDEPGFNPQTDTLAAVDHSGQVACLGWVFPPRISPEMQFIFLSGMTHPQVRRRGLGKFVMNWQDQRGRAILAQTGSTAPAFLRGNAPGHLAGANALFQNAGFTWVRSSNRMRREFSIPIPEPQIPSGLRLVAWDADRLPEIYAALNEAFHDHWAHVDMTKEEFLFNTIQSYTFHPEFSFLVLEGDIIAGVCLNRIIDYDNQRTGIQEGWIGSLGVRRPWRKHGVGSALLNASMRTFQQAGYTCAGLTVDSENLTGALHLYERLGFGLVHTIHIYMKQI